MTQSQATRSPAPRLVGIAHFNHKLRGEESDEDERFVAALAAKLGLPLYGDEARLVCAAGGSACHPGAEANLEQNARRARREFFSRLIQEGAADRVALGHTRDDQAETVLFRMLRGSGLAGLAGIHPVTAEGIIRPLIGVTRSEVEEYLRERGNAWREDQSNRDLRFARNRIRHRLLPQLARDWNPQIGEALAHLADLAFEEERWWHGNTPDVVREVDGGVELSASDLVKLPRAVVRRVVRRAISKAKGDLRRIEFDHVEAVVDIATGAWPGGAGVFTEHDVGMETQRRKWKVSVPGINVMRSFDHIRFEAPRGRPTVEPITIDIPGTYETDEGSIRLEIASARLEAGATAGTSCANLKAELAAPIVLRGWRPGDHYRPVGKSRDQKLKEMFQNARIPSWRRHTWPILESGGKILWAREFGVAEEFAANTGVGWVLRVWDLTLDASSGKILEPDA